MIDRYAKRQKTASLKDERPVTIGRIILVLCLLSIVHSPALFAKSDSIYQATQVKLDILSPILVPGTHNWQLQHYEVAVNVRLKNRFFPTFEVGYAGGNTTQGDTVAYQGQGGFFRVGCDIHPLKKHPESPHSLLVGVRLGTAAQRFDQTVDSDNGGLRRLYGTQADCWGEIVAGCQVEVAKVNKTAFYMGWMGRLKLLFTRSTGKTDDTGLNIPAAIYIPGFGARDNIGWGLNYYLGWRF